MENLGIKSIDNKPFLVLYVPLEGDLSIIEKVKKLIEKETKKSEETDEIKCDFCEKTFKRVNGLTSHLKICKEKPVEENNEE